MSSRLLQRYWLPQPDRLLMIPSPRTTFFSNFPSFILIRLWIVKQKDLCRFGLPENLQLSMGQQIWGLKMSLLQRSEPRIPMNRSYRQYFPLQQGALMKRDIHRTNGSMNLIPLGYLPVTISLPSAGRKKKPVGPEQFCLQFRSRGYGA